MPNAIKWEAGWVSRGTVLTTQLNALANDARSAAGSEIANQTNLDQLAILELLVTFAVAPAAGAIVQIHMIQALDGTNYEDGSDTVDPGIHTAIASIPVKAVTTAQRVRSNRFLIDPAKTKFILLNKSGQAFPATGSTLTLYTTNDEVQ